MAKVSVIIPSRNERFMEKTVDDLFAKATGDIEVIVTLDGYWPNPMPADRKNLIWIHRGIAHGMRAANNAAATIAKGKYLMKCDAHCMFAEGFDEVLQKDCDEDWIVIPRRYSLDALNWTVQPKGPMDYHYLCFPELTKGHDIGMHGVVWGGRRSGREEILIDDTPSFQGSCWFMHKDHFANRLQGMSEVGYGTFSQEPQEIGNKTWLSGGRIVVNKKTWYAHLHKGTQFGRGYRQDRGEIVKAHNWSAYHWMADEEPNMKYKLEWLIEKFWPMPTWEEKWIEDWNTNLERWKAGYKNVVNP